MNNNTSNTDSTDNHNDSLDQYMETLVNNQNNNENKHKQIEIHYNDNENEEHLVEFYNILNKNREKEKNEQENKLDKNDDLYIKKKDIEANTIKTITPTLTSNQLSTREHIKDIYIPDDEINKMSLEECIEFKKRLNIETFGTRVPKPISTFLHLSKCIPKTILNRIEKLGFIEPTPVQCQTIPCILQGRNTIILSETGSGKTISYLIPIVVQILNLIKQWKSVASKKSVYAVILTLTRELCHQVYNLVNKLCKNINLRILLVSTGVDKTELFKSMLNGCEIAICTPARLIDLISLKGLNLIECKYFVLDESDKMFTKDYQSQVLSIVNLLRDDTLTVFVSASTTDEIYKKIKSLVRNSITIKVGQTQIINLENIELKFLTMFSNNVILQKKTWLADNISYLESKSQNIIFCNTRQTVEELYTFLSSTDKTCCMIYGDMLTTERHNTLNYFKKGYFKTLIATDLVCRGVDIPSVGCVINYDTPKHFHTFLHRVGRCGRANTKGISYTLFSKQDNKLAAFILNYLESASKNTNIKINIPEHLKKFAMTFTPYKDSKRLGVNFIDFVSKGSLMKQNNRKDKTKRTLEDKNINEFVTTKQQKTFGNEVVASKSYEEQNIGGREYNATDDILSSSDED